MDIKKPHSHNLDLDHLEYFIVKVYVRELCKSASNLPRPSVQLGMTLFPNTAKNPLINVDKLIKWLCEMRSRMNIKSRESSPPPNRRRDVDWDHPELDFLQPRLTSSGELFLRYDGHYGQSDSDRVVIFAAKTELDILTRSKRLYCDGTFENCPRQWAQLVTLHGSYINPSIPLVYILLPNKTFSAYNHALVQLRQLLPDGYSPKTITTDFESGLIRAFRAQFPEAEFSNCFVHLLRNVKKNLPKPLLTLFTSNESTDKVLSKQILHFKRVFGLLWNLAFLPASEIKPFFHCALKKYILKNALGKQFKHLKQQLRKFIQYFESTWVGNSRKSARFPPSTWSIYKSCKRGAPRNNNHVEAWHYAFKVGFGSQQKCNPRSSRHPTLKVWLQQLKSEQALCWVSL